MPVSPMPHRLALGLTALAVLACTPGALLATATAGPPRRPTSTRALTPAPTALPTSDITTRVACPQDVIDAIEDLHAGYPLPEYLQQPDAEKRGDEFDVNTYFTVLKHLSMETGYVLDYVYHFDGMGGSPVLYARKAGAEPYRVFSEYERATSTPEPGTGTGSWLDHVRADGTPEGFLELVILRVMANQFYQFWHSGYNDHRILCNPEMIDRTVSSLEESSFGNPITPEAAAAARALDAGPGVALRDEQAIVEVILFTKWGGFRRVTFPMQRDFPHMFGDADSQVLVPYDCGVMF